MLKFCKGMEIFLEQLVKLQTIGSLRKPQRETERRLTRTLYISTSCTKQREIRIFGELNAVFAHSSRACIK